MATTHPSTPKLVVFGVGGDLVHYSHNHTSSGYGTPDNPHAAADLPDGVPVVDLRPAVATDVGRRQVFVGPMVNVDLHDDEIDRFDDGHPATKLVHAATKGNSFGALLGLSKACHTLAPDEPGPLDFIPTTAWIARWRRFGARIGTTADGSIIWERIDN